MGHGKWTRSFVDAQMARINCDAHMTESIFQTRSSVPDNSIHKQPKKEPLPGMALFILLILLAADGQPVLVLLSSGHPSPDMTLRFIHIQHNPRLGSQGGIDMLQAVGYVFMFRRYKLECFRLNPNLQTNAGKYLRLRPYLPQFSG